MPDSQQPSADRTSGPAQSFTIKLVQEHKLDRTGRKRGQERACKARTGDGTEDQGA